MRIYFVVITCIIFMIRWRAKNRGQIKAIHPKPFQMVQLVNNPAQIAPKEALRLRQLPPWSDIRRIIQRVTIIEAFRKDFIDNGFLRPIRQRILVIPPQIGILEVPAPNGIWRNMFRKTAFSVPDLPAIFHQDKVIGKPPGRQGYGGSPVLIQAVAIHRIHDAKAPVARVLVTIGVGDRNTINICSPSPEHYGQAFRTGCPGVDTRWFVIYGMPVHRKQISISQFAAPAASSVPTTPAAPAALAVPAMPS